MTPDATATATAEAVSEVAAAFMLDGATYARGAELGFEGLDFYTAGRGGALGPVAADVVTATFVFWTPGVVRASWERGLQVMEPHDAADRFAAAGHAWAEEHLADVDGLDHLADLLGAVVAGAPVAAAPLFAAWRARPEPEPDRPVALVLHRMHLLRELRGALHGAAVLAAGLTPHEAVTIRAPGMLGLYGYDGPAPSAEATGVQARWAEAEAATDRALAPAYAVLDGAEQEDLRDRLVALLAAVSG
ncbi:hypothetical protein PO878_06435 [Iamia majanohamensis]|uniref:Uncharacterized protein n=1 Tax=Iamia majanohamensis TaxID=467976 RepID=A0AAF0BX74_9ACTN|nr:hypothetical protein [Iamia majanohamensis]WCO68364.1 hypothetical protein PO878_06435 [Iamia majanohamensis]